MTKINNLSAIFLRTQANKLGLELERLKKKKNSLKNFPDFGTSAEDSAQEVTEFTTDNELKKKIDQSIKDITQAMRAINQGTYGICRVCHDPIMPSRLKVMPETTTCAQDHKK